MCDKARGVQVSMYIPLIWKMPKLMVFGAAASLLAAGCSGSGSGDRSQSASSPPPPAPPPLFSESVTLPDLPGTSFLYVAEAMDLDFNGTMDLVLSGPVWRDGFVDEAVPLHVYLNNNVQGEPEFTYSTLPGNLVHPRAAVKADLNGDGVPDLAIGDHGYDNPPSFPKHEDLLLLSDDGGKLQEAVSPHFEHLGFSHDIAGGDIDNDGDIDLAVADMLAPPEEVIRVLTNDGDGQFSLSFPPLGTQDGSYTAVVIADVNTDGNADLVLGASYSGVSSGVMIGDGQGNFDQLVPLPDNPDFEIVPEILATDVNADGNIDLVLSRTAEEPAYQGRLIQILINDGGGNFTETPLIADQDLSDGWTTEIYFVDMDEDNRKDIVLRTDNGRPNQSVFLQQSDGTFAPIDLPVLGGVFPFDVDNDGDLDLLVYNDMEASASVQLLINNSQAL